LPFGPQKVPPLPIYVQPACAEEALLSWLLRLATRFKMSLHALVSETFGIEDRAGVSRWWCRPDPWLLARISQRTGLHIAHVRRMTFGHLEPTAMMKRAPALPGAGSIGAV
jgi:hypothetical protein